MINIGTRIEDYVIIAIANGYALAANSIATSDFVVWKVERERIGVCEERRFNNLMDAEWEFCSLAFEWFQDNVLISDEEDEEYKRSSAEARVEVLEENLSAAHRSLAAAMELVEEMFAEHDRLCPKEDRVTDEPIEKVAREFAERWRVEIFVTNPRNAPQEQAAEHNKSTAEISADNLQKMLSDKIAEMMKEYRNRVKDADDSLADYCNNFFLRNAANQLFDDCSKSILTNIWNFDTLFL